MSIALVRQPKLLVFDEASSALDAVSERLCKRHSKLRDEDVQQSLLRDADAIAMLERDKAVELGTNDELLVKNGKYVALVKNQVPSEGEQ